MRATKNQLKKIDKKLDDLLAKLPVDIEGEKDKFYNFFVKDNPIMSLEQFETQWSQLQNCRFFFIRNFEHPELSEKIKSFIDQQEIFKDERFTVLRFVPVSHHEK